LDSATSPENYEGGMGRLGRWSLLSLPLGHEHTF
jgi:hypothetical protein